MSRAPAHPSLPQNDDAAGKAARAAQITQTRTVYEWTTTIPTLPGLPLSATVPKADDPTLDWFLILAGVLLQIARNELAVKLASLAKGELATTAADIAQDKTRCDAIEASLATISAAHTARTGGNVIERAIADVESVAELAEHALHLAQLRDHACELRAMIELSDDELHGIGAGTPPSIDAYRAQFATLPVPAIAYTFEEDDVFARLRVAGPNPMLIKGIAALPDNFPLAAAQYAAVVNGDTLAQALAEGRLFLCDYAELEVLVSGMWDGLPKFTYHPMALFAVPPGGASLVPVAIQCGQDCTQYPLFTPGVAAADKWGWEIAKFIVQVADGNYHELFAHLARTHLVIEAIAVSTRRTLASVHPLWALLVPHFEGTLFINNQAATSLIAANGPIDHIFGGTITSSQLAAVDDRLAFDFYGKMLPADLAARGVDNPATLPDYPYRDDALLVWQALAEWAREYVSIYYADDAAVTGDTELAAWCASIAGEAQIKGFTAITTRDQLIDVCTMIMFTASAQHAAVNFPQKDIMAFAPAVTGAGWSAAPAQQGGADKPGWIGYMPPLSLALEQLNVLTLLGSVHYRPLGDYRSTDFPYQPWFQDTAIIGSDAALPRFQAALQAVDAEIAARNVQRQTPYPYLQPSLIPTSINI